VIGLFSKILNIIYWKLKFFGLLSMDRMLVIFNFKEEFLMKASKKVFAAVISAFSFTTVALADDLILSLSAEGTIGSAPVWLVASAPNTSASFDFAQTAPGAGQNVNSVAIALQLNHSGVTGAKNIALSRPTGCAVGGTTVSPSDVAMVFDGTESATNGNVSFTIGTSRSAQMRFKANYGTATGAVSCSGAGSLTYTY
jgi:hypothetical protein